MTTIDTVTHASLVPTASPVHSAPPEGQDDAVFERLRGLPQLLLTSGQTLPNMLSLHELGASGYVMLCTREESPERLRSICSAFGYRELSEPILVDALDERRTELAVREGFRRLTEQHPEASWVLNTTCGTKPACLGATRALGAPDANVPGLAGSVYYDSGLRSAVPGWSRVAQRSLRHPLGVAELLQANGILPQSHAGPVPAGVSYTFALSAAPTAEDRAAARAIAHDPRGPLEIGSKRRGQTLSNQDARELMERYVRGAQGQGYLGKSPANFFNGLWLECYVYDVLDRHRASGALPIDDVQMGVKLQRVSAEGRPAGTSETDTDLDVCWSTRNLFSYLSCKSGAVDELPDEVFEVCARRKPVGGTFGGGALFHVHQAEQLGRDKQRWLARADKTASSLGVTLLGGELLRNETALVERLAGLRRR